MFSLSFLFDFRCSYVFWSYILFDLEIHIHSFGFASYIVFQYIKLYYLAIPFYVIVLFWCFHSFVDLISNPIDYLFTLASFIFFYVELHVHILNCFRKLFCIMILKSYQRQTSLHVFLLLVAYSLIGLKLFWSFPILFVYKDCWLFVFLFLHTFFLNFHRLFFFKLLLNQFCFNCEYQNIKNLFNSVENGKNALFNIQEVY